ncbi:ATP-dependent DNA helicase PIF1-like [Corticium candelabrum]|uniref:ATP-dependent DNA helicase PIF1-like n=1 Tax=Corticium candelabrum TaxID=121492 RepID=UPI002E2639C6|nr:ATP-dependent DNA helicase PIF1-like [Corticium candelabrum]
MERTDCATNLEEEQVAEESNQIVSSTVQDWMLLCQHTPQFLNLVDERRHVDWSLAAKTYENLDKMPHFIAQHRQFYVPQHTNTVADPERLQGNQLHAYNIVREHFENGSSCKQPLRMIVSGTAGTGKSYLIQCLKRLLGNGLRVAAPTGVAAFNVNGYTLHSLLGLPIKGDFKELESNRLRNIQESLAAVEYIIIDEMSMVGRKLFGQVGRRLRQVFPHRAAELFGGCSCLLIGDWGQLPPVMDLPLYTTESRTELSDLGSANYRMFDCAIVLDQVMRQAGLDSDQQIFRNLLLRLRNAESTIDDWRHLMRQTPAEVEDIAPFTGALHLYTTTEAVAEHNTCKLRASDYPVATIKAFNSGADTCKASADDAGGLEPIVCIAHAARNPPQLPVAVTVKFDNYTGPTLPDGTVPITPLRRSWFSTSQQCSRLQLPLKLAWAITIHKAQGMTINKVVIDVGKREFASGLTFVASSRVRRLNDLLFVSPFPFQRIATSSKSSRLNDRLKEDARLQQLSATSANRAIVL